MATTPDGITEDIRRAFEEAQADTRSLEALEKLVLNYDRFRRKKIEELQNDLAKLREENIRLKYSK